MGQCYLEINHCHYLPPEQTHPQSVQSRLRKKRFPQVGNNKQSISTNPIGFTIERSTWMSNEVDNVLLVFITAFTRLNHLKSITSQVEAKHFWVRGCEDKIRRQIQSMFLLVLLYSLNTSSAVSVGACAKKHISVWSLLFSLAPNSEICQSRLAPLPMADSLTLNHMIVLQKQC